jgi:hypothetical protein
MDHALERRSRRIKGCCHGRWPHLGCTDRLLKALNATARAASAPALGFGRWLRRILNVECLPLERRLLRRGQIRSAAGATVAGVEDAG